MVGEALSRDPVPQDGLVSLACGWYLVIVVLHVADCNLVPTSYIPGIQRHGEPTSFACV